MAMLVKAKKIRQDKITISHSPQCVINILFRFGNFWSEDAMMTDELSNEESNCWSIKHVTPTIMNLYFVLLCSECVF